VIGPDERGIKTEIEYTFEGDKKVKTTRRFRLSTREVRVSKDSRERRKRWRKFGKAEKDGEGVIQATTMTSYDEITIEDPADAKKKKDGDVAINLVAAMARGRQRRERAEMGLDALDGGGGGGGGLRRPKVKNAQGEWSGYGGLSNMEDSAIGMSGMGGGGAGKYVPPSMRTSGGREAALQTWQDDRDKNSLRVTNVSEDATEDDLRELFAKFGRIQRIYLARDRETNMSRGFCFVTYHNREDAQLAMDKLHGYGYDHLILNVEWSKPSTRDPNKDTQHRTGYGKALPQGLG
jgi:translation initiation factor 3 subunit G